nr:MAG TPA: hypothetical protein [Bacteriophage sp.]
MLLPFHRVILTVPFFLGAGVRLVGGHRLYLFVEITISCYISCVNTYYINVYIKFI